MKVSFKASDKFTVEAEGSTHVELFGNLAGLSEIFSISQCGNCKKGNIVAVKRVVDDTSFYEFKCKDCNAKLSMGQNKKGGALYPRKKYHEAHPDVKAKKVKWDKENPPYLPNGGWEVYKGERNDAE